MAALNKAALSLRVITIAVAEPAIEFVALVANEVVPYHVA